MNEPSIGILLDPFELYRLLGCIVSYIYIELKG